MRSMYQSGVGPFGYRLTPWVKRLIIANTVKGKGVPAVEGRPRAHFTSLRDHEVKEALAALEVK